MRLRWMILLFAVGLLVIVEGKQKEHPNLRSVNNGTKLQQSCLECNGNLGCFGCRQGEICQLKPRTCNECGKAQCIPNPEDSSVWIVVASTVGATFIILLIIIILYQRRTKPTSGNYRSSLTAIPLSPDTKKLELFDEPTKRSSLKNNRTKENSVSTFWSRAVPEDTLPRESIILPIVNSKPAEAIRPPSKLISPFSSHFNFQIESLKSDENPPPNIVSPDSSTLNIQRLGEKLAKAKSFKEITGSLDSHRSFITSSDLPLPSPIKINPPIFSPTDVQFGLNSPSSVLNLSHPSKKSSANLNYQPPLSPPKLPIVPRLSSFSFGPFLTKSPSTRHLHRKSSLTNPPL